MSGAATSDAPGTAMIATLCARGDLKVWSLLVTLFGDAAMAPGAMLSGPQLSEILGLLKIRPEAQRVALHRLRKEGWITATRQGRIGLYGLSAEGREETAAVAAQVYAPAAAQAAARHLLVLPDGQTAPDQGLCLGEGRFLSPVPGGKDSLSAPLPGPLPQWVADAALPAPLLAELQDLSEALDMDPVAPESTTDAAALRLLILHQWRRLVLRLPPEAEALLGPDWVGARCRARVATHLATLPRLEAIKPGP
ncbi:PaaX family transcriptional regulator C-terminal domain-containing protein [Dinoroseobacter sp. S76]|uniref:PaaX family transcriptional regulator C-terminal domain-containing protein n=1 Tax=Dinoroseobacter sp. S76 TaxID=3415124 RepID=UPI003C799339